MDLDERIKQRKQKHSALLRRWNELNAERNRLVAQNNEVEGALKELLALKEAQEKKESKKEEKKSGK